MSYPKQSIYVTLPAFTWSQVLSDRVARKFPDGRPGYKGPPIGECAWFRTFIRTHHSDPIVWPPASWLYANGEGGVAGIRSDMPPGHSITVQGHAVALMRARSEKEHWPMAACLRRLIRQYFEGLPKIDV